MGQRRSTPAAIPSNKNMSTPISSIFGSTQSQQPAQQSGWSALSKKYGNSIGSSAGSGWTALAQKYSPQNAQHLKNVADDKSRTASAVAAAKDANSATGIAKNTLGNIFGYAKGAAKGFVKDAKSTVAAVANPIQDAFTGKKGTITPGTIQADEYDKASAGKPDSDLSMAVQAVGAASDVIGSVAGAADIPALADRALSAAAGTDVGKEILGKLSSMSDKKSFSDALDVVKPKLSAKETSDALAQGRGKGGGMFTKTKIAPDTRTLQVADSAKGIVKKGAPASKNIANLRNAISTEAESLKSKIASVDHPYSFKELNSRLSGIDTPISVKGTAFEKQIGSVKKAVMAIAKKNGGKISSLLDSRKDFDSLISKEYPTLYDSASAPMKNAVTSIRNTINDFIEENLPEDASFKESLSKQSRYYDAIDSIADKSVDETRTTGIGRIGRAIRKHPIGSLLFGTGAVEGARKVFTGNF